MSFFGDRTDQAGGHRVGHLQAPYHLARQLLSLDHLRGPAGWNLVTCLRAAADNFSARGVVDHVRRTVRRRRRSAQVVRARCGRLAATPSSKTAPPGSSTMSARSGDRPPRRLLRRQRSARRLPPVQGQPVLFQAGSSPTGRSFAAKHAEVIFTSHGNRARAQEFLPADPRRHGRSGAIRPPLINSCPSVMSSFHRGRAARTARRIHLLQPRNN